MEDFETSQWQRNQLVAALWRYTLKSPAFANKMLRPMHQQFESRVKKMLNLDRIPSITPWGEDLDGKWAFYDEPGKGTGNEELYSTIHVFIMSIALELQYIGLKQPQVIYYLKHTKPLFVEQFKVIHAAFGDREKSDIPRKRGSSEDTVWMAMWREEPPEPHWGFLRADGDKAPTFSDPIFFHGLDSVRIRFGSQLLISRHMILLEIADAALLMPKYLEKTAPARRGRK